MSDKWSPCSTQISNFSILDRMLDSYLKEEEKRTPLILPSPSQYRFVLFFVLVLRSITSNIHFATCAVSKGFRFCWSYSALVFMDRKNFSFAY